MIDGVGLEKMRLWSPGSQGPLMVYDWLCFEEGVLDYVGSPLFAEVVLLHMLCEFLGCRGLRPTMPMRVCIEVL